MGSIRRFATLTAAFGLVVAACTGSGASPSTAPSAAPASQAPSAEASAPASAAPAAPIPGGLLDKIMKAGKLVVSTDPKYPPQSALKPDGTFEGFDIDVATEIAKRLGVKVEFDDPRLGRDHGRRLGRTLGRQRRLDDDHRGPLQGSRLQPALLLHAGPDGRQQGLRHHDARRAGGQDGLRPARRTTYDQWLNGNLDYGTGQDLGTPPAGVKTVTLPTDTDCPDQWKSGRNDFEGWLSSITTVDGAIKAGLPVVKVGDPVYFEPLAVSIDKGGPADTDFLPALKKIIDDMHADGTLTTMSMQWFGTEYTKSTP